MSIRFDNHGDYVFYSFLFFFYFYNFWVLSAYVNQLCSTIYEEIEVISYPKLVK